MMTMSTITSFLMLAICICIIESSHAFSFANLFSNKGGGSQGGRSDNAASTKRIDAAVIVPGFLTGASDFESMRQGLTDRGIPTVTIPMTVWDWIPCLGGRSARPILERVDFAVRQLAASDGDVNCMTMQEGDDQDVVNYSLQDIAVDFFNNPGGVLKVGGSYEVEDYPAVEPRVTFNVPTPSPAHGKKIILIGHSAGGWISQAYLSQRSYGGKVYGGDAFVHSLITLGSPLANAPGPAFSGVRWCNEGMLPRSVRALAIGGTGVLGSDPQCGALTKNSYSFCCPDGSDGSSYDGDGVTPLFSAHGLQAENVERWVLKDVAHAAWPDLFGAALVAPERTKDYKENSRSWYGSDEVLDDMVKWINSKSDARSRRG